MLTLSINIKNHSRQRNLVYTINVLFAFMTCGGKEVIINFKS